jgi:tripartite-type tricarboxylate transporter receptor subunit TctC
MKRRFISTVLSLAAAAGISLAAPAQADEVADFYKGKTMTLLLSTGVGGSNDLNARIFMNHMTKHLPGNPGYKAVNMPGAGHVRASNYLYNRAPKDGTYVAAIIRFFVLHQALGGKGVKYDARKFHFLGSSSSSNVILTAYHTSGIKKFDELKNKELIVGGTGVGSGTVIFPNLFNTIMGTKIKIVQGYKSGHNIDLAMERGEVFGRAGWSFESVESSHPGWIKDRKIHILTQVGIRKERGFEHIPMAVNLVPNAKDKAALELFARVVAVGSPFNTTPGVPKARVDALRKAFDATMKDKAFIAALKAKRLSVKPTGAAELTQIVHDIINAPPEVIAKARSALSRKGLVKYKDFTQAKYCRSKKKRKKKKS